MVAYTKPQQMKKEECRSLRGERDQIKLIDVRFEAYFIIRHHSFQRIILEASVQIINKVHGLKSVKLGACFYSVCDLF